MTRNPQRRPKLFIGSSREAMHYGQAIHANLARVAQVLPWYNGTFNGNDYTMEALERRLGECDFGVFVFAPDDVALVRGKPVFITRDNTMFEAGLFYGRLGRSRVFCLIPQEIAHSEGKHIPGVDIREYHLLSDLSGLTLLQYEFGHDDEYEAATSVACSKIAKVVEREQFFQPSEHILKRRTSMVHLLWEYARNVPLTAESTLQARYEALAEAIRLSFLAPADGECKVTHVALYVRRNSPEGLSFAAGNIDRGAFYPLQQDYPEKEVPIVVKVHQNPTEWSFTHVQRLEMVSVLCYPLGKEHVLSVHMRGDTVLPKEKLQDVVEMNGELLTTIELLIGGHPL